MQEHVLTRFKPALLPTISLLVCTLQNVQTPVRHSLFVNTIAWLFVTIACVYRIGVRDAVNNEKRKKCAIAGILYALALGCERAATDKAGLLAPQVRL